MKILKTLLCGMLVMSAIATSASANDIIDPQYDPYAVAPVAESNEISDEYDTSFVSGDHGWGQRIYNPGGWFSDADATTEVWGDFGEAVADQTPYAYVLIKNTNDGTSNSDSSSSMDSNRYCQAYAELDSNYATSVKHTARLSVNGSSDFNETETITN